MAARAVVFRSSGNTLLKLSGACGCRHGDSDWSADGRLGAAKLQKRNRPTHLCVVPESDRLHRPKAI